jgi:hypothetical protein
MPEDTPDEPNKATGKPVLLSGKATATSKSYGYMQVRLIQSSPATDPKLLKRARKIARELKKNRDAIVTLGETSKAATSTKAKAKFASKKPKAVSYEKKSLSLFPVK